MSKRIGNEQAVAMDAAARNTPGVALWEKVKSLYSPRVQAVVDAVAEAGGVSLAFIELLEVAEHERLAADIGQLKAQVKDGHKTSTAVSALYSLRLQSRKHMRTLRLAMSPISSPNDMRHPVPSSVAQAIAEIDAHEVDPSDTGDELLS